MKILPGPTPAYEASRSVLRDKMIQPLSKEDETDAEVTWEDQNNINSFSKLHNKLADLQDLLAEKNTHLEALTDAVQEIELLILDEDEGVPYKIGDSFYTLTADEATERMEQEKTLAEKEIGGMEEEIESVREELNKLKVKLYGKFGSSINLEK